ncbi:branched-chain amino acid ABC transporter substrate-binding protein [Rhodopila sp.]|jgi:branched-chain amino acid transport system substrate-binding protein|uniref:branched-chain amino acid ABC transporter substrate-binding protein n=1 Tax=Rhodopila sp. TaxID=2480087 RepID=UPI002CE12511|nr:branched-chain amino acid ABC transporter substrate-binding protein [Rhodopila sp.]HVZ10465.1 branched-chain amino acid ABC transporter substrate-binding protein [Rhodopila sp.]
MTGLVVSRRTTLLMTAAVAALGSSARGPLARAADKTVSVGVNLSLTGADADSAKRMENGAIMAFDEFNAKGGVNGYKIVLVPYDDGTATSGQYDPAQAATNARKMVADRATVAAIGPQMSGAGKAMAPILSQGGLAIITPSSTNPDITDPKYAAQYRPAGKPIYFRTVATDAYQGPYMANFYADVLHVKSVYILDDSGAYGVGLADSFQAQAEKKGIKVLGRDRLDPKAADYTAVLTKIKSLNPDALYYGGVLQAGVKLAKQSYDIIPKVIKGGGDGAYGPEMLTAVGAPANQGWYATIASPHVTDDAKIADWDKAYTKKFGIGPDDYAVTTYDAALVIIAALKRITDAGKVPTREAMRDAIQGIKVDTLQGPVSFDANGDLTDKTISIFQIGQNKEFPDDDMRQYKYIGVAPSS